MTRPLFREDAYLRECEARVVEIREGGIVLDATVFYARAGGQPGDSGKLIPLAEDGTRREAAAVRIADAIYDRTDGAILHIPESNESGGSDGSNGSESGGSDGSDGSGLGGVGVGVGARVFCVLDWERRYRLMRAHTAMHLLYACAKWSAGAVTGSAVGELRGRIDFDMPDPPDRAALEAEVNRLMESDLEVGTKWITAAELRGRPELSPGAPPPGSGDIRLVEIPGADLQACGGTHLRRTAEAGKIRVAKMEKKGKRNRRIVIELEP